MMHQITQKEKPINFNGHNLEITGEPDVGDTFTIKPSDEQSILNSIQALIHGLEKPSELEHQRAHLKSLANQGLQEIDQALDEILNLQTTIGARLRTVDTAENLNSELIINNKATISSIEDLDVAEAIIKLNADSIALEAAQQSFAKIQNLSIFNYL